ncbi:DUF4189 domain-containing protein [Arthrobacter sp. USHLN218]|uniref:DUF4189 domain-containing protein n=1 Tax=Arthrobacter sp. USHLN218 TaxID=3081232 RepID=UPI003017452E
MNATAGRRSPLTVISVLLATLFAATGLTVLASPANAAEAAAPQAADRYLGIAFSPSTLGWYAVWSSNSNTAYNDSLDLCNLYQSDNTYDCVQAGVAKNEYLALALSTKNGPWGSWAASTATTAGKNALAWCKYYGGGNDCTVEFNESANS